MKKTWLQKILFAFLTINVIWGLVGCSSTTVAENKIEVEPKIKKEEMQGIWRGEYDAPFTAYLLFSNEAVYYMSSKSVPTQDSFTSEYKLASSYDVKTDDNGNTICTFDSILSNYIGIIDDSSSSLSMTVDGKTIDGNYELISSIDNFQEKKGDVNNSTIPSDKYETSSSTVPTNNKVDVTDDDELGTCWSLARDVVKSNLKSPSSAKFPFSYSNEAVSIQKSGSTYYVEAWVEANNSYGTLLRSNFTVIMERSGDKFTEVSCVIDD